MLWPWLATAWVAGLSITFLVRVILPADIAAPLATALAGPYDLSGFAATWIGTVRGAGAAGLVMAAAWGWGRILVRDPLDRIALGLVGLALAVFGVGVAGLLRPIVLVPLLVAGLWLARDLPRVPVRGTRTVTALFAGIGALLLFYGGSAMTPEVGWDALTYHLRAPSHFLAAGRIHSLPWMPWSYYPFQSEMWFTLGRLLGDDPGAKLVNFAFLPLLGWALADLGIAATGSAAVGWGAALLYLSLPAAAAVGTQTYNDLEPSLLGVLAVRAAARGRRSCSAVFAGAALGCKYPAAGLLPVVAALWFTEGRRDREGRFRALAGPVTAGALVILPWPARDWLWTANPVYPLLPGWFDGGGWNPYQTATQAAVLATRGSGELPWTWVMRLIRLPVDLSVGLRAIGASFSPLLFGFLPGAVFEAGASRLTRILAASGAGLCVLWAASPVPDGRYLLPALALLAVPAAAGAAWLMQRGPGWRIAIGMMTLCVIGCQVASWVGFASATYLPWRVAVGLEPRAMYLGRALLPNHEYIPMATALNARLPPAARVLMFSDISSYYIEREVVFDTQQVMPPVAVRLLDTVSRPVDLRRRLRQLGLTHILVSSSRLLNFQHDCHCLDPDPSARPAYGEFWRRYAVRELELGSLALYHLRSERQAAERTGRPEPFVAWPGVQEAFIADAGMARMAHDLAGERAAIDRLALLAPDLAEAPLQLAQIEARARRFDLAGIALARARRLGADSGPYWMLTAVIRSVAHDRAGAVAAAREGAARWPIPAVWVALAKHALVAGDMGEARRALGEARRLSPNDPEVRRAAALLP